VPFFGTELEYYLSNNAEMVLAKKHDHHVKEQEWENPADPEKPGDERDQEQLLRQLKEAKRRKDNLTEDDNTEKANNNI
jgi:hypothetical protein